METQILLKEKFTGEPCIESQSGTRFRAPLLHEIVYDLVVYPSSDTNRFEALTRQAL